MAFPVIVINPQYSPFKAFKRRHVLMTEPQLISYTAGESILTNLSQGAVVPLNVILILRKLDKIIYCLSVIGERNCYNGILIVILW